MTNSHPEQVKIVPPGPLSNLGREQSLASSIQTPDGSRVGVAGRRGHSVSPRYAFVPLRNVQRGPEDFIQIAAPWRATDIPDPRQFAPQVATVPHRAGFQQSNLKI